MSNPEPPSPEGYAVTLRASINAGALAGLFLGLFDGLVASWLTHAPMGPIDWLGSLAATVFIYGLVYAALLTLASPLSHRLWRGRTGGERYRILFGLGLGIGVCLELYWWSREYLFWGYSALSPERLAVAAGSLVVGLGLGWGLARLWARTSATVQRLSQTAALLGWLGGAAFLFMQAGAYERADRGRLNERNRELPNVLLIVVDALRQDVLGCYGNQRVATPHMDELAREGVLFENAFVQAPFTWTSFASWLTGKYPRKHGLLKMAPGYVLPSNITLAWHLKGAPFRADSVPARQGFQALGEDDYVGAVFMTGTLSHGSRLDRGFDVYSEANVGHGLVQRDSVWSTFKSDLLLFMVHNKLTQRVDYNLAATTAVQWFEENADRRFVSMVHLYNTHTPYAPAAQYRERYCDPAYEGPIVEFRAWEREAIERGEYAPTEADVAQIQSLYYGGTTQADASVGRILAELEAQGVLEDTIVVLTSDHGEDLGEGGRWEHNHMYETNLRVPLIIRWPEGLPRDLRVSAPVDSIDLVPTLCELIGIEDPQEEGEFGTIDGESLLELIRGERGSMREFTCAENGVYVSINDGRYKLILRHEDLDPEHTEALRADPRAATVFGDFVPGYAPRFFDLDLDPSEENNLYDPAHPEVQRLFAEMQEYDEAMPIRLAEVVESHRDRATEDAMRGLGYTDGAGRDLSQDPEDE